MPSNFLLFRGDHSRSAVNIDRRTLHAVDLENLAGTPELNRARIRLAHTGYEVAVSAAATDYVLVGSDRRSQSLVTGHWADADQYVFGAGQDGADHALVTAARFLS